MRLQDLGKQPRVWLIYCSSVVGRHSVKQPETSTPKPFTHQELSLSAMHLTNHVVTLKMHKRTVDVATVDTFDDNLGRLAINLAPDTVGGSQDFLHSALEFLGEGLISHSTGDVDDFIQTDGLAVLDVFLLLSVTGRFI